MATIKPRIDCAASKGDLCFLRSEHTTTYLNGEATTLVDYIPGIVRHVTRNGRVTGFETANGTIHKCQRGGHFDQIAICRQVDLNQPAYAILQECPQGASMERLRSYMLHYRRMDNGLDRLVAADAARAMNAS